MSKRLIGILGTTILLLSLAALAMGQTETTTITRVTKTVQTPAVQNPDGTYTIVEYPVGREMVVNLSPVGLSGARGTATILRDPSGTATRS